MLSNVDLNRILGKHIGIYPFSPRRIEGASIDLTASCYAWSLRERKSIVLGNEITIGANDTAIIFTNEAISLDQNYAGACFNRISFSTRGINHSSSPLKPGYTGKLSVAIHNDNNSPFKIRVGDPILVIMLFKLHRPASETAGNGNGSRFDILSSLGIQIDDQTRTDITSYDDRKNLLSQMKADAEYKKYKKQIFKTRRTLISTVATLIILGLIVYYISIGKVDDIALILITAGVTVFFTRFLES